MTGDISWAIIDGHTPEAIHYYPNASGEPFAAVVRFAPGTLDPLKKSIRQYRFEGDRYVAGLNGRELPLYRSADLLTDTTAVVYVVEGELCADVLHAFGLLAVTNAGGAGKWRDALSDQLKGRGTVILPDDDEPGRKHAQQVASSLHGTAAQVRVMKVLTPDSKPKGEGYDVADWFADGGTLEQLESFVAAAPLWTPTTDWGPTVAFAVAQEPEEFALELALPPVLAAIALAIAEHTRVDVVAPAVLMTAVISAAAGNAFRVQVNRGHVEPNLSRYVMWVKPSGERGTATVRFLQSPIDLWAKTKEPAYIEKRREAEMKARVHRHAADQAEKKAAKATGAKREEEFEAAREEHSLVEAPPAQVIVYLSNVTEEMLTRAMAGNGGACAIICGDARHFFDLVMGQYRGDGRTGDSLYLRAHGGDTIDRARIGKVPEGEVVIIVHPALAVAIAVQPDKFDELSGKPALLSSGFLPRCNLAFPRSLVGTRLETGDEQPIDPVVRSSWEQIIRRTLDQREKILANSSEEGWSPKLLVLSPEAMELRRAFANEIELRLGPKGDLRNVAAFGSKCAGEAARLAALIHIAECAYRDTFGTEGWHIIPVATWRYAEAFQRWQIAETLRVLGLSMEDQTTRTARRVLNWISEEPTKRATITTRDLIAAHLAGNTADATAVLEWLAERNWVRLRKPDKAERSPRWDANPKLLGGQAS